MAVEEGWALVERAGVGAEATLGAAGVALEAPVKVAVGATVLARVGVD